MKSSVFQKKTSISQEERKNMELKRGSNQDEWSQPLKVAKMPKPNGALV